MKREGFLAWQASSALALLVKGQLPPVVGHIRSTWENISVYKNQGQRRVLWLVAVSQSSSPVYRAAARTQHRVIRSFLDYVCVYHPLANNIWGHDR